MTASRDIAARLTEPHTLDIRNIVEVRAILDLVAVERAEAAAEIASLRLKVEERDAEIERSRKLEEEGYKALHYSDELARAEAAEARLAALEDQNRALEAATIEKCLATLKPLKASRARCDDYIEGYTSAIVHADERIRALASIPREA